MDSWNAQLELARSRIAEIEDKIALQRQRAEQPLLQNDSASLPIRLLSVLQESLARAKEHAQYIEQRIAVHEADSGRRRARSALINVAQIECRIADLDRQAKAIENAIHTEEDRTAQRMIERRDNVMKLIDALKRELVHAKAALVRACADAPPPAALTTTTAER